MRLLYVLFMMLLWAVMASGSSLVIDASAGVKFLALAIMIAGAMAGSDGK